MMSSAAAATLCLNAPHSISLTLPGSVSDSLAPTKVTRKIFSRHAAAVAAAATTAAAVATTAAAAAA
jgi:hypothetical protein